MSEFKVLNQVFHYKENEDRYAALRNDEEKMKQEALDTYRARYKQLGTLQRVVEAYEQDTYALAKNIGKHLYNQLANYDIFNISEQSYLGSYTGSQEGATEAFEPIANEYVDITLSAEERDAYRTARRQNRGRVQGGGYGLEGAVKGMAAAGTINAATNVIHGTFNLIGKGVQTVEVNYKLSSIYKNEKTLEALLTGVYDTVTEVYNEFMNYVCGQKKDSKFFDAPMKYQEAEGFFSNAKKPDLAHKRESLLVESLRAYPFDYEVYAYIIDTYGDEDNQVSEMAKHFVSNWDVTNHKASLVDERFLKLHFEEEAILLKEREEMQSLCQYFGVDVVHYLMMIDAILEAHDENARTSDQVIYDTREEANQAEAERLKFVEMTSHTDGNDEEKLLEIKAYIEANFQMKSKARYIAYLDEQLAAFDLRYKEVRKHTYETREEAEAVRVALREIHGYLTPEVATSVEAITEAMSQIESQINLGVKAPYLEKLQAGRDALLAANTFMVELSEQNLIARLPYTRVILEGLQLQANCTQLSTYHSALDSWLEEQIQAYCHVKNVTYENLILAARQYYKLASNAATYAKNVLNKSTEKKSFFGKLTSTIKGGVSQIFAADYNYITDNGILPIPEDVEGEAALVIKLIADYEAQKAEIQKADKPYVVLETPFEIASCLLNGGSITKEKPRVNTKFVNTKIAEICKEQGISMGADRTESMVLRSNETYNVVLTSTGNEPIKAIKYIREATGLDLKGAKELIDHTPSTVLKEAAYEKAIQLKLALEEIGATVEMN